MKNMLAALFKNLNRIEVRGQENLALLYNSIDSVNKLMEAVPETLSKDIEITELVEGEAYEQNTTE